jgi:hypothetical protein
VAVPSRSDVKEYQDLKEEMDKLVGMINGKFSTAHWSPIRYIYGCIEQVCFNGKIDSALDSSSSFVCCALKSGPKTIWIIIIAESTTAWHFFKKMNFGIGQFDHMNQVLFMFKY